MRIKEEGMQRLYRRGSRVLPVGRDVWGSFRLWVLWFHPCKPLPSRSWESGGSLLGSVSLQSQWGSPSEGRVFRDKIQAQLMALYFPSRVEVHHNSCTYRTFIDLFLSIKHRDVHCDGHVISALQIWTHLILQLLCKVGTSASDHFTDQKMEAVLGWGTWPCTRNMLGELTPEGENKIFTGIQRWYCGQKESPKH